MDTGSYDLNIRKSSEDPGELWEGWEDKPTPDSKIRLGSLEDPLSHPEFLEIIKIIKPTEIITTGRILGTPGDPRRTSYLDGLGEEGSAVTIKYSKSPYCLKALRELSAAKIKYTVGVEVGEGGLDGFWKDLWDEDNEFLLIPKLDVNGQEELKITPEDLKDRKNIKIIEYRQNILMTERKIIITKDSINLKPIKVYDRF